MKASLFYFFYIKLPDLFYLRLNYSFLSILKCKIVKASKSEKAKVKKRSMPPQSLSQNVSIGERWAKACPRESGGEKQMSHLLKNKQILQPRITPAERQVG